MDENKPKAKWLDKYDITSPDHVNDLETQSAIHEFTHKLPRHEAEQKAYEDYVRERTIESASHHLAGMKAAQASGDMESARKHGTMYTMALKQLGHPEIGEIPTEIQNHMKHSPSKVYRFKGHDSDSFLAGGKEDKKDDEPTMAKSVAKVIVEKLLKAKASVGDKVHSDWEKHIKRDHAPKGENVLTDRSKCKVCEKFAAKTRK